MAYYAYAHEIYPSRRPVQRPAPQTDPIQQSPPSYASCTNQPYVPGDQELAQPGDQQATCSRKFMIRFDSFWKLALTVLSPDGNTPLYKVRRHSGRRPQVIVSTAAAPNIVIGTVGFHYFSSRIDVQVRNSSFILRPRRFYGSGLCYASPAWDGANLWWKHKSFFSRQLICLYEEEMFVAKFGRGHGGFKNIGEIEVDEVAMRRAPGGETAVIEEALMVGLAWIEFRRRNNQRSNTIDAGGSS